MCRLHTHTIHSSAVASLVAHEDVSRHLMLAQGLAPQITRGRIDARLLYYTFATPFLPSVGGAWRIGRGASWSLRLAAFLILFLFDYSGLARRLLPEPAVVGPFCTPSLAVRYLRRVEAWPAS